MSVFANSPIIATDRNQNIYVTGSTRLEHQQLVKLFPDGNLDKSFGKDGKLQLPVKFPTGFHGLRIQDDGILVSGWVDWKRENLQIWRLKLSGEVDKAFGKEGKIEFNPFFPDLHFMHTDRLTLQDIILLPEGRFLVMIRVWELNHLDNTPHRMMVLHFKKDGGLEKSFGKDGFLNLTPELPDIWSAAFTHDEGSPQVRFYCYYSKYSEALDVSQGLIVGAFDWRTGELSKVYGSPDLQRLNFAKGFYMEVRGAENIGDSTLLYGLGEDEHYKEYITFIKIDKSGYILSAFGESGIKNAALPKGIWITEMGHVARNGDKLQMSVESSVPGREGKDISIIGYYPSPAIAQFTFEGILDAGFGKEGILEYKQEKLSGDIGSVLCGVPANHCLHSYSLDDFQYDGDGKYEVSVYDTYLQRLNAGGTPDVSFGKEGVSVFSTL